MLAQSPPHGGFCVFRPECVYYICRSRPMAVDGSTHISICVGVLDPLTAMRGSDDKNKIPENLSRGFYFWEDAVKDL